MKTLFILYEIFSPAVKSTLDLKNVKPKVDAHRKRGDVPTANAKRRNSPAPILVTTKSIRVADPMVPYLVEGMSDTFN